MSEETRVVVTAHAVFLRGRTVVVEINGGQLDLELTSMQARALAPALLAAADEISGGGWVPPDV